MTGTCFLIFIYIRKTHLTKVKMCYIVAIVSFINLQLSHLALANVIFVFAALFCCFTNYILKPNLNDQAAACEMLVLRINLICRRNYFLCFI